MSISSSIIYFTAIKWLVKTLVRTIKCAKSRKYPVPQCLFSLHISLTCVFLKVTIYIIVQRIHFPDPLFSAFSVNKRIPVGPLSLLALLTYALYTYAFSVYLSIDKNKSKPALDHLRCQLCAVHTCPLERTLNLLKSAEHGWPTYV